MNNKILARIVATIMAVMMLGTVSFAASLTGANADVSDVTHATGYKDQTEKTFIAFCTADPISEDPTAEGNVIVALDQISEVPTEFTIDTDKIGEATHLVVMFGGTKGITGRAVIKIPAAEEDQPVINVSTASVFEQIVDGTRKIYENVFYAKATTTGATGKTYGFSVTNPAVDSTKEFVSATTINGDAEFEFGILFVGVPANAGLTADAFLR